MYLIYHSVLALCRSIDIDELLAEVGELGRYQKCYIFFFGLALLFTASSTLSFVFTTGDMNYRYFFDVRVKTIVYGLCTHNVLLLLLLRFVVYHVFRCLIPECDTARKEPITYKPYWLNKTVPFNDDVPAKCLRYVNNNQTKGQCQYYNFNRSSSVLCQDGFVFEEGGEVTIVSAVSCVFFFFCILEYDKRVILIVLKI